VAIGSAARPAGVHRHSDTRQMMAVGELQPSWPHLCPQPARVWAFGHNRWLAFDQARGISDDGVPRHCVEYWEAFRNMVFCLELPGGFTHGVDRWVRIAGAGPLDVLGSVHSTSWG